MLTLLDKCATIRNGDALHAWLSTVARHEAIRASVCSRRTVAEDLDDRELAAGTAGPDDQAITLAMTEAMVSAVAGLSPMRAELVHLRYFAGLSYAEIHRATGVPVGSIGPTIGRALTTLRAHVEQSPTAA